MKPTIHQIILDNIGSMDITDDEYDLFMNHAAPKIHDAFPLDTTDPTEAEVIAKFNQVYTAFVRSNFDPYFALDNMTDDERHLREALADVFCFQPLNESGYRTDVIVDGEGYASIVTSFGIVFRFQYTDLVYTEHMNRYTVNLVAVLDTHDDPQMFEDA